ncbi:hypothetical protein [Pseudomonas putida]|uniref:hypothetical protein n=1 Tax=Pseudomonas putida TaxID=303 RepID=UPI0016258961|nr:hypothetical protein [Pseudomonas putida]QNG09436.1 hypothetical protein GPM17_13565 [Pseudomonas putida]HDS1060533.1 hypothetical protein [Pseudomonas putida]
MHADPNNPSNGISLEVSILSNQPEWFKGFKQDEEVVVLGIWRHSISESPDTLDPIRRAENFA